VQVKLELCKILYIISLTFHCQSSSCPNYDTQSTCGCWNETSDNVTAAERQQFNRKTENIL